MSRIRDSLFLVVAVGTLLLSAMPAVADWNPADGHKMHFPQLPDESGWDVNATYPKVLADDWTCSGTGWVKDIHFWGSWMHGLTGQINSFQLSIHSNIADGGQGFSIPGPQLWNYEATSFPVRPIDPATNEGWYDPNTGYFNHPDHSNYFQYNIFLPQQNWFWQQKDTTYWLDISANVQGTTHMWGWKTSLNHYMDDAVWGDFPQTGGPVDVWHELTDPITGASLDMAFVITPEPGTLVLLTTAGISLFLFAWRRRK